MKQCYGSPMQMTWLCIVLTHPVDRRVDWPSRHVIAESSAQCKHTWEVLMHTHTPFQLPASLGKQRHLSRGGAVHICSSSVHVQYADELASNCAVAGGMGRG